MNRKTFLQLAAGALGALALGVKAKAKASPTCYDAGTWTMLAQDYESPFDAIEVCGVPVYCDPYCPENKIYVLGPDWKRYCYSVNYDNLELSNAQEYQQQERWKALICICGAIKTNGESPSCAVINTSRWEKMRRQDLDRDQVNLLKFRQAGTTNTLIENSLRSIYDHGQESYRSCNR